MCTNKKILKWFSQWGSMHELFLKTMMGKGHWIVNIHTHISCFKLFLSQFHMLFLHIFFSARKKNLVALHKTPAAALLSFMNIILYNNEKPDWTKHE